jgi:hypothetical protein
VTLGIAGDRYHLDYSNSYFSGTLPMANARPVSPSDVSFTRTVTTEVDLENTQLPTNKQIK